ncbi:MAG: sigma-70 family RNA polymerase sigma factor [Prevotella sp.]|nr:sigma-70 family RNA polymerase sigma factor [Prevotella sp.]
MELIDKKRFEQLFVHQYPRLLQLAKVLIRNDEESKDVVSDLFAQIGAGKVQLPDNNVERYLATAVRNRCINWLKKMHMRNRVEQLLLIEYKVQSLSSFTEEERKWKHVLSLVGSHLTVQTARVFRLRYQEHKKYGEISKILGINEAAVYKHIAQAIKKLSEQLKTEEDECG